MKERVNCEEMKMASVSNKTIGVRYCLGIALYGVNA